MNPMDRRSRGAGRGDMDKLSELVAKNEIEEVLFRYARGVDRRDWDAVRSCFHGDAIDQHGEFSGTPPQFIEWVTKRHANVPFSLHFLGNCLVEFIDDGKAAVETYFIAMQRREKPSTAARGGKEGTDYEVFGRYCDLFEKRQDVWRIASRKVVYDSTRTQPSSEHLRQRVGVIGTRDPSDPVFRIGSEAAE